MSEIISLFKDSNIITIKKSPLSNHKCQFTPYETSTYNCQEINDEIIELDSENQKRKANSVKYANNEITKNLIDINKEKLNSKFLLKIKIIQLIIQKII